MLHLTDLVDCLRGRLREIMAACSWCRGKCNHASNGRSNAGGVQLVLEFVAYAILGELLCFFRITAMDGRLVVNILVQANCWLIITVDEDWIIR